MTRSQSHKRKAANRAEYYSKRQSLLLNSVTNQNEDSVPQLLATHAQPANGAPTTYKSTFLKKTLIIIGVQKAANEMQKQTLKKAEKRSSIYVQIAKALDDAIEPEALEQIEKKYISHIISTILECALLKLPLKKNTVKTIQEKRKTKSKKKVTTCSVLEKQPN